MADNGKISHWRGGHHCGGVPPLLNSINIFLFLILCDILFLLIGVDHIKVGFNMSVELSNAELFISWLKTKSYLNSIASNASRRFVKRGQVYWCQFGINVGSEMSKATPRPAIVVSNFGTNKNSSNVIVVPVTHNTGTLSCLVPLTTVTDNTGNVILDGQANTANLICVSKARLGDLITTLSAAQMRDIDKSMPISLELLKYYDAEVEKYDKLSKYSEKVKEERNAAQDKIKEISDIISANGFDENSQKEIRKILDIE